MAKRLRKNEIETVTLTVILSLITFLLAGEIENYLGNFSPLVKISLGIVGIFFVAYYFNVK